MSRLKSNFIWLCIGKFAQLFNSVIVMAWVARYLGTGNFGKLASAIAVVGLAAPVVSLGMDRILARELVAKPEHSGEFLGTAILAKLVMSFLIYVCLATLFFWVGEYFVDDLNISVYLICLCGLFAGPFASTQLLMESRLSAKVTTLAGIGSNILIALMRILCVVLSAPLIAFAIAYLIGVFAIKMLIFFVAKRIETVEGHLTFSSRRLKSILAESWPLMVSHVAVTFYLGADVVMLAWMRGDSDAGIYSFAAGAINTLLFFPQAIGNSFFPSLVEASKAGIEQYKKRQMRFFRVNSVAALIISLGAAVCIPSVLMFLLSDDYSETGALFRIQTIGLFFFFFGVARGQCLIVEGRIGNITFCQIAGLVVNVLLNLILIPRWGIYGAAYATAFSYSTYGIFSSLALPSLWPIAKMQAIATVTPNMLFPTSRAGS